MKVKDLTPDLICECPVWTWDESREYYVPVGSEPVLPTDTDVLFVRARITTPSGRIFDGIIVNPPVPYAVELFAGKATVGFNRNAPQLAEKETSRLYDLLRTKPFDVFPLQYETDFHFPGEPNIAGVFDMEHP